MTVVEFRIKVVECVCGRPGSHDGGLEILIVKIHYGDPSPMSREVMTMMTMTVGMVLPRIW